jgi:hypothetical protein
MPNHTSVRLYFPSDARKLVKKYLSSETDGSVFLDFNKIIPMPKELNITSGSVDLNTEEGLTRQAQYDANKAKYGFPTWYEWCIANWGTKWNSYSVDFDGDSISLQTAWSPPCPVIEKLAKLIKADIRMTYLDEGFGYWGETYFHANGDTPLDFYYTKKDETPDELDKELGISSNLEEYDEVEAHAYTKKN